MFMNRKVVWSPVEIDFLKENREKMSINQLSLALAKSRNAIKRKCDELDGKPVPQKKAKRSVVGTRPDLKKYFRSNWEANVARWFNHEGITWEYEPEVFTFKGIKHGTTQYCPDFRVDGNWIEVKGMLDGKGRAAIRRFKKYFPQEFAKLKAIVGRPGTEADEFFKKLGVPILAYMNELTKEYKDTIAHWE